MDLDEMKTELARIDEQMVAHTLECAKLTSLLLANPSQAALLERIAKGGPTEVVVMRLEGFDCAAVDQLMHHCVASVYAMLLRCRVDLTGQRLRDAIAAAETDTDKNDCV